MRARLGTAACFCARCVRCHSSGSTPVSPVPSLARALSLSLALPISHSLSHCLSLSSLPISLSLSLARSLSFWLSLSLPLSRSPESTASVSLARPEKLTTRQVAVKKGLEDERVHQVEMKHHALSRQKDASHQVTPELPTQR